MKHARPRSLTLLLGALGVLVLHTAPVGAAISHKPTGLTFGTFTKPTDVTVDQSNGNVYVTDSGGNVVKIFGAEGGSPVGGVPEQFNGAPKNFSFSGEPSQVAIDESGGASNRDVYVSDAGNNVVDKFQLNMSTHEYVYLCQFTGYGNGCVSEGVAKSFHEPDGVAVDSKGNLYIANFGPPPGAVYEFDPGGANIKQFPGVEFGFDRGPVGVALDSLGDIYVNTYHRSVIKIDAEGHHSFLDQGNGSKAVAVDPATNNVYVDDGTFVNEYDAQGIRISTFGVGVIGLSEGIAVNGATGQIYVSDQSSGKIEVFGPPVTVPDVTTGAASKGHRTSATISGSVNPDNAGKATYYFQYGESNAYGLTTEPESTEGNEPKPVSASLTGLERGSTYHYRLVAENANGPSYGEDRVFTTVGNFPGGLGVNVFNPCVAANVQPTSATLNAITDPEGISASYYFQYGKSTEYGVGTTPTSVGAGETEEPFVVPIAGLVPNTLYHCRLVGEYREIEVVSFGEDQMFMTPVAQPAVNDRAPFTTGVSLHEATLHAAVNPGNDITTYHFVYGPTSEYGSSTTATYTQVNYADNEVEQLIMGLQPGTLYHYALIAGNSAGTTTGPDETFTTLAGTPPAVETGDAREVSPTTATLSGVVDPAGQTTSYEFQIGTSTSYGTQLFGAVSSREEVTATLAGLLPGTTYHYRLLASDAAGTGYGADRTFTTPALPALISQPATLPLLATPPFPPKEPTKPPTTRCKKGLAKMGSKCVRKRHRRTAPRARKHT
jgi:DNA-binding beta-propeller fold protein YncE